MNEDTNTSNEDTQDQHTEKLVAHILQIYNNFIASRGFSFALDYRALVNAISDSQTDIKRTGSYHSKTGADELRHAAYIVKWIATHRPICTLSSFPVNLANLNLAVSSRANASFCVYVLDYLVRDKLAIKHDLMQDLYYCFQFRYRMDPESIYLLLKHAK